MTYTEKISSRVGDTGLIPALVNVIKTVSKEKVVRLAIATLRVSDANIMNNNYLIFILYRTLWIKKRIIMK